jgi:hypothetical protein
VLETEVGGDLSLYHPASETVAVLNATASDVWRLCDGDLTLDEAVSTLARAYGIAEAAIVDEVARVVDDLTDQGFLSEAGFDRDQDR